MNCLIYLRKSRADEEAESRGEVETLARHERILLEVAKKQKLIVGDIFREVVSGETIASRPMMQRLLSEVEQGIWESVLVVEVERLARGDTIDQGIMAQAFKYSNTKIITPNKTYDPQNEFDEEYFEFGLFMSRREYKTINRRLQAGRLASIKEGHYVGNVPPYGYVRKKLEKGFTLEPDAEQAAIVKLIYELYTASGSDRKGVSLIVRHLNDLHIPAAKGVWTNSSIRCVLSNPVYFGKVRWNYRKQVKKVSDGIITKERPRANADTWTLANGLHMPIVTEETFNLAQKYLSQNISHPCPKQTALKNPLADIIKCAICGRNMVRRPYQKKGQEATLMCPVTSCKNVSSRLCDVETKLIDCLATWINSYKPEQVASTTRNNDIKLDVVLSNIERNKKEREIVTKQIDKTHELLEQGIYNTDTFLARIKILSEKIKDLDMIIETNKKEIENNKKEISSREKIIPIACEIVQTYRNISVDKKNELLKQILIQVDYKKEKRFAPFTLTIYPRI
jgi:DNA invertase Pin-like site-specific DNA recombinase